MSKRVVGPVLAALVMLAGLAASCPAADTPEVEPTVVWKRGDNGYYMHRIPAIVLTKSGTLLAFAEARKNGRGDHGDIDLVVKRSTDMGKTWSDFILVYEEGGTDKIGIGNHVPVVDRASGDILVVFRRTIAGRGYAGTFLSRSNDDGATWTAPREITESILIEGATYMTPGPGHGIQLQHGKHAGRICIPCYAWFGEEPDAKYDGLRNVVVYSDDGGKTWTHGTPSDKPLGEPVAAELGDGTLIMTSRQYSQQRWRRAISYSKDGGETWSEAQFREDLPDCNCQGSILSVEKGSDTLLLHSNCPGPGEKRNRLTVRLSRDGGKTWPSSWVLDPGKAQYNDLVELPDGSIGCLYERGDKYRTAIVFVRFSLERLTR